MAGVRNKSVIPSNIYEDYNFVEYSRRESVRESVGKPSDIVCIRESNVIAEAAASSDNGEPTIDILAAAMHIIQAEVEQQQGSNRGESEPSHDDAATGLPERHATGQKEENKEMRLNTPSVIVPLSEQEELLLAINNQGQMNSDQTYSVARNLPGQGISVNYSGAPISSHVTPITNMHTRERCRSFPETDNFHVFPSPRSVMSTSHQSSPLMNPIRRIVTDPITNAAVTTSPIMSSPPSTFPPLPRRNIYDDPFGFHAHAQFLQQQASCSPHALLEYQQMLNWEVNGTVPPQYPLLPPPTSPQQRQLQFHTPEIRPPASRQRNYNAREATSQGPKPTFPYEVFSSKQTRQHCVASVTTNMSPSQSSAYNDFFNTPGDKLMPPPVAPSIRLQQIDRAQQHQRCQQRYPSAPFPNPQRTMPETQTSYFRY